MEQSSRIVIFRTGQKDIGQHLQAYRRALGSLLYIGHDICIYPSFEMKLHALKHLCCYSSLLHHFHAE